MHGNAPCSGRVAYPLSGDASNHKLLDVLPPVGEGKTGPVAKMQRYAGVLCRHSKYCPFREDGWAARFRKNKDNKASKGI